jgi:transcription initiation factor TFIID subunit 1
MQNRQKLKEFMSHSKEHKEWEMRSGEIVPDSETLRSLVQPEDVCLLEAMQVGQQHLEDGGFGRDVAESGEDDGKEDQSIERQLAPWNTSKNFLNAAAGKAMVKVHGEGDPTGRGEGFSLLRTSMKGGFIAAGESVEDKLDAKRLKELGGHSYNVAKQQKAYEESIQRVWELQKQSLSSTVEHSDTDMDQDEFEAADDRHGQATPRSEMPTPMAFRLGDNETMSQVSKFSADSQGGRVLRISRQLRDKFGKIETVHEIVRNAQVIHHYTKRRRAMELENFK